MLVNFNKVSEILQFSQIEKPDKEFNYNIELKLFIVG